MVGVAKYPFKRIGRRLRKLEAELEGSYGFAEGSVWYPSERFIEEAHEMVLEEYGGHAGYETGIHLYNVILGQVKATDGIYQKAAVLLRKLSTRPCIYADGNHRLALVTVETFLRKNGLRIWTKDSLEISRFIKGIMQHNIDEIAEWLRNGPKESSSNKDSGICDGKKV
jgi:prophage maintenance system killer protein